MANEKLKQNYKDIANAIRSKTGENGLIKAEEMPDKIDSIHVGIEPEGTKEIRANGEYNIREFENVNVDVPGATTKDTFETTENGTFDIAEYANVKVDVPQPEGVTQQSINKDSDSWAGTKDFNVNDYETLRLQYDFEPSGMKSYATSYGSKGDTHYDRVDCKDYSSIEIAYRYYSPYGQREEYVGGASGWDPYIQFDCNDYSSARVYYREPSEPSGQVTEYIEGASYGDHYKEFYCSGYSSARVYYQQSSDYKDLGLAGDGLYSFISSTDAHIYSHTGYGSVGMSNILSGMGVGDTVTYESPDGKFQITRIE